MSKIYEALEHAHRERKKLNDPSMMHAFEEGSLSDQYVPPNTLICLEEEMLTLYKSIDTMLNHSPQKLVQFIAAMEGEGTSTIVREFARICAMRIGKSVLLLDTDRVNPSQHTYFGIPYSGGWLEVIKTGRGIGDAIHRVEDSSLFVAPSTNSATFTPEFFDFHWMDDYLSEFRNRFDIVLVDSPPFTSSPDGIGIAPKMDGVVIVIEAERTKWTVVENLKENILKAGGNILGVVFNKRRYHIPQSIYDRL